MTRGTLGVLNVGAGDTKLTFDKDNPMERARSARIVTDMLSRGYVLFIATEVGGKQTYRRVLEFDEDVCEYIIADFAPPEPPAHPQPDPINEGPVIHEPSRETPPATGGPEEPKARRGRPPKRRVAAGDAHGIVVPRVAGG